VPENTIRLLVVLVALATGCVSLWSGDGFAAAATGRATHIALTLQPTSIIANGSSSSTATATVTDARGNRVSGDRVEFSSSDPGQSVTDVGDEGDGTYTALIRSSTTSGTATITATDTTAKISASRSLIQTAPAPGTSLSLVPFPSTVVTNETVTLIATVSSSQGSPSGTVTFMNGAAPVTGCISQPVTPTHPVAVCQMTFAASTSPDLIKAAFSPSPGSHLAGASAVASVSVGRDSTSTSIEAPTTIQAGAATTYVATVSPPAVRPGPVVPSGSVEFLDGGQPIGACGARTLTNGQATCTVTYSSTGSHSIAARYGGDGNFVGSTSPSAQVSVIPVPVNVLGIINATMQWSFTFGPTSTDVLSLVVNGASPGGTVLVTCHGRGCPFRKRAIAVTKTKRCGPKGRRRCLTHGRVDLTPALENHPLRVGARLSVRIIRRGWIGRYFMFTVRARRGPQIQIACLAPGGSRPGVGC
jgi:Bacterial Ig-like domain (group 3)/Invasin, domain 3